MATNIPKASVLLIAFLILSCVYSFSNVGITLKLIHRDTFNTSNNDRFANLRSAFRRSFARQRAFSNSLPSSSPSPPDPNDMAAIVFYDDNGDYVMKFRIGTPPVQIIAFADTGSDLTWTQCTPCQRCFDQFGPLFDPTRSSSYSQLSCSGSGVSCSSCDERGFCSYHVTYKDGSYSNGDYAFETFTFDSDSDQALAFPKVLFGCGRDSAGEFGGIASGIVGLGGGSGSIIRQLDGYINGRFSYCLTSPDEPTATSAISFGNNAVVSGPNVVSTPLFNLAGSATFYCVWLKGISVGDEAFMLRGFDRSVNDGTVKEDEELSLPIIIDSGATLTFVPRYIYDAVESLAAGHITGTRVSDPQGIFGLCYDTSSGGIETPKVVFHFDEDADVALPDDGIFVQVADGMRCLGLAVSPDNVLIFGNLLQMNYHIGFDLKEMTVSFMPTDCSQVIDE